MKRLKKWLKKIVTDEKGEFDLQKTIVTLMAIIAFIGLLLGGLGWLQIKFSPASAELDVTCERDDNGYCIKVVNRGNGIARSARLILSYEPIQDGMKPCPSVVYNLGDIEPSVPPVVVLVKDRADIYENRINIEWTDESGRTHTEPASPAALLIGH